MADDNGRQWWESLPGVPLDSVEQLDRFGIPRNRAHSCSRPDGKNNLGCPMWDTCQLPFKGTRPHNGGIEILKPTSTGVRTIRNMGTCFGFNAQRRALDDMEGVVDWVANEGEMFVPDGTELSEDVTLPGQPKAFSHKPVTREIPVPEFVVLAKRKETQSALRLEERRSKVLVERESERRDRMIGIKPHYEEGSSGGAHQVATAAGSEAGSGEVQSGPSGKTGGGGAKPR